MKINEMVKQVHDMAVERGWWEKPRNPLELQMLIVSEIAEACEEARKGTPYCYQIYNSNDDENNVLELKFEQGIVLVDWREYSKVKDYGWYLSKDSHSYYLKANKGGSSISYHNFCYGSEGYLVDHIDGNSLNNLRSNIRVCTPSQNQANQKLQSKSKSSQFKGVTFNKLKNKWIAQIGYEGNRIYLGQFESEKEAALKYDEAAIYYFGSFAKTNLVSVNREEIIVLSNDPRWSKESKVEGEAVELADAVIRIMDYFGHKGWDLEKILEEKIRYNASRPYRHGGKKF